MKKLLVIICFLVGAVFCKAQPLPNIQFVDSASLFLNKLLLSKTTSIKTVIALLGEPSKKVNYPKNETSFFYENIGIMIMTNDSLVQGVGINFNWDGDKKFPSKTYTGILKMGELVVAKDTKSEEIKKIKTMAFECPISLMCTSKPNLGKVRCMVSFDSDLISQIVFLLK